MGYSRNLAGWAGGLDTQVNLRNEVTSHLNELELRVKIRGQPFGKSPQIYTIGVSTRRLRHSILHFLSVSINLAVSKDFKALCVSRVTLTFINHFIFI